MSPPVVLTIAGSDSGGGAGIQADLKTFAAHGVFGTSVITALTAQNTVGVTGVHAVPADFVAAQLDAVLADLDVRAVKTGMLGDPAILAVVADYARAGRLPNLVVDPVVVATSGDLLYRGDPVDYLRLLTPHATVLTPNIPEARVLGSEDAAMLARAAGTAVVLKGGHADGERSTDTVADGERLWILDAARIDTVNTHGTGCTFSAAIAVGLARGADLATALRDAKSYITGALAAASTWRLGRGHGPVDHFWRP
ncbi:bifunctional hydroxymethylpyrimidine kinase/phosphomethylpyrimidine kinase [Phytomonospora endophytica]|uniref:Hydroxymethylpyrimidine/phosphomethylpyrimidine kinase n=1 Tax=Phytomonospora endophytica TaxID=714109 RepID=A0A841FAX6_9ACTN|nr:bifunctional hydroxymethylpyrimidine kinase/phosphomethylpyrimidine kinase [Phytomonospora endophytica]MBB6033406.1 hydroxymethylpyrimidine/phosphomethylpyrimidine kinase [Phytomonospora endophytica]GIG70823.1 hydroxymethylpyrimidine/phosphomethylpyrimidine kinase [Phytomonospora endophytica]